MHWIGKEVLLDKVVSRQRTQGEGVVQIDVGRAFQGQGTVGPEGSRQEVMCLGGQGRGRQQQMKPESLGRGLGGGLQISLEPVVTERTLESIPGKVGRHRRLLIRGGN